MGDYKKQQNTNIEGINLENLALILAKNIKEELDLKTLLKTVPHQIQDNDKNIDDFKSTKSLEQLAQSMIIQRNNNEANFNNLGNRVETKKDNKEINKTINLLKNLD